MTSVDMTGNRLATRPSMMEKQKSVTMEFFLETSNLDFDTAELLQKYDIDGNGSFSKDEVVAIILDLRQAITTNEDLSHFNRLFKRVLIFAGCFCVLLLTSMFCLSYTVAVLTAKTDVDPTTNSLITTGSHIVVSTNSRAQIHYVEQAADTGAYCLTSDEIELMRVEVLSGKNVALDQTALDGTGRVTYVNGMSVMDVLDGSLCFQIAHAMVNQTAQPRYLCWNPNAEGCNDENSQGVILSDEERAAMGIREGRSPYGSIVIGSLPGSTADGRRWLD